MASGTIIHRNNAPTAGAISKVCQTLGFSTWPGGVTEGATGGAGALAETLMVSRGWKKGWRLLGNQTANRDYIYILKDPLLQVAGLLDGALGGGLAVFQGLLNRHLAGQRPRDVLAHHRAQ